ncbi:uncharacterized protein G2W53_028878 [Senna tora]|uniref:Uncharacterized protein n=1 Tax=Senna tora TaxID=362788 RepID=A0A834WF72_9FABA|nr:uncharacterized protein G2W53_028878 [Senna tora]
MTWHTFHAIKSPIRAFNPLEFPYTTGMTQHTFHTSMSPTRALNPQGLPNKRGSDRFNSLPQQDD